MVATTALDINKPLINQPTDASPGVLASPLGYADRVLSKFNSQPLVDDCANTACNLKEGC
ncbi:MAG: hypothetical protein ACI9SP_001855 [Arenicella sp.]|jgi:hypothetical protein